MLGSGRPVQAESSMSNFFSVPKNWPLISGMVPVMNLSRMPTLRSCSITISLRRTESWSV